MTNPDALAALEARLAELSRQVARLEGTQAVRALQYKYGYYIDKCLYGQVVELFSDAAEVRFLNGVYRGSAGVRRLYCDWFGNYFTRGSNGPVRGLLLDHLLLQDVIDIDEDGVSARGRFRCLLQGGAHESMSEPIPNFPRQFWEAGIYENLYVREGGVWKIKVLHYHKMWQADYQRGWAYSDAQLTPFARKFPEDPNGPDELLPESTKFWPDTRVVPFHYPHPVTGESWQGR
jgi:hypothetical protein